MKGFCLNCNETKELVATRKKETYPVKGEEITIEADVVVCDACRNEVFVREIDCNPMACKSLSGIPAREKAQNVVLSSLALEMTYQVSRA